MLNVLQCSTVVSLCSIFPTQVFDSKLWFVLLMVAAGKYLTTQEIFMDIRTRPPTQEQSAIVERVARIVTRVRGAKPDSAGLAEELEPAIPFDVFGIVLLRHDKAAVRVVVCTHESDGWISHYHQHPLKDSMFENILQCYKPPSPDSPDGKRAHALEASNIQDVCHLEIKSC